MVSIVAGGALATVTGSTPALISNVLGNWEQLLPMRSVEGACVGGSKPSLGTRHTEPR